MKRLWSGGLQTGLKHSEGRVLYQGANLNMHIQLDAHFESETKKSLLNTTKPPEFYVSDKSKFRVDTEVLI
jgi:hypothetical protein